MRSGFPATGSSDAGGNGKVRGLRVPHVPSKPVPARSDWQAPTVSTFLAVAGVPTVLKVSVPLGALPLLPAATTTSTSGWARRNLSRVIE